MKVKQMRARPFLAIICYPAQTESSYYQQLSVPYDQWSPPAHIFFTATGQSNVEICTLKLAVK
eukprot:5926604-Pleurochrysis_carterae.AAC.1